MRACVCVRVCLYACVYMCVCVCVYVRVAARPRMVDDQSLSVGSRYRPQEKFEKSKCDWDTFSLN